jgi:hypothetical protein
MCDPDWFEKHDRDGRIKGVYPEPCNHPVHPQRFGFATFPLTEAQLQTIEARVDHALPPFFRLLYSQLANGGFGPGYGLADALSFSPETDYQLISLEDCLCDKVMSQATGKEWWRIPERTWPSAFYQLVEWGCGNYSYLDLQTGRVYQGGVYGPDIRLLMSLHAPSFEAFMVLWAHDERLTWG